MRAHGPDYLAYALLDTLVDRYFVMLDHLSDMAEELEDQALSRPNPALPRHTTPSQPGPRPSGTAGC